MRCLRLGAISGSDPGSSSNVQTPSWAHRRSTCPSWSLATAGTAGSCAGSEVGLPSVCRPACLGAQILNNPSNTRSVQAEGRARRHRVPLPAGPRDGERHGIQRGTLLLASCSQQGGGDPGVGFSAAEAGGTLSPSLSAWPCPVLTEPPSQGLQESAPRISPRGRALGLLASAPHEEQRQTHRRRAVMKCSLQTDR